jgi:acyl-ACP thioesterase
MAIKIDSSGLSKENTYKESFITYSCNCDSHSIAKLDWFFEIVQEVAAYHGALLECSIFDLRKLGLTWVISRENIVINKYPKWREKIILETWAEKPFRRVLLPRIIEAKNEQNELLFRATTLWAIIDLKTKRPIDPNEILNKFGFPPKTLEKKFYIHKREFFNEEYPIIGNIAPNINYFDTDSNKHVNNISYLKWTLQSLPNSFRDKYVTKNIDVSWLKQTFIKDKVKLITNSENPNALEDENPIFYHKLVREDVNGKEQIVFEAKSIWEKRN